MLRFALVGRPNVGKSSLFNRLIGKKKAIVHAQPGVTRDYNEGVLQVDDCEIQIIDTPGLADPETAKQSKEIARLMTEKSYEAMQLADVIGFVIDGKVGITPYEGEIAKKLYRFNTPVVVIVNKSDVKGTDVHHTDILGLGFSNIVSVSAEHNLGCEALIGLLIKHHEDHCEEQNDITEIIHPNDQPEDAYKEKTLKLAIMGRPNVGKSTLVNSFIKEKRLLTADYAGVTRDAIKVQWHYNGRDIELVDTAGMRKRAKVDTTVESLSVLSTRRVLQFTEMAILVIDGTVPEDELIEKQDLIIAEQIISEGRGLVIAVNKSDKISNIGNYCKIVREQLNMKLSQVRDVPVIAISATGEKNLDKLMHEVLELEKLWNMRIPTAKLNDWLKFMLERHPTPVVNGTRIRLKYMTQIKKRPPTFAIFASKGDRLPSSYVRYLSNGLRDDFNLPGVPIRITMKRGKNPYVD